MTITFEPDFRIRPIRVWAEPVPDDGWFCRCTCTRRESWYWDKLPRGHRGKCPIEGCPFRVIVVVLIPGGQDS